MINVENLVVYIQYLNIFHISYVTLYSESPLLCHMYLLRLASGGGTERVGGVVVPLEAAVQVLR